MGPLAFVGYRAVPLGCMGARTLVPVGVACTDLPFFVLKLLKNSQQFNLQDISAFILSPELETICQLIVA